MDLSDFMNTGKKKCTFKVTFKSDNAAITRFASAYSEDEALKKIKEEAAKDHKGKKLTGFKAKNISERHDENTEAEETG